MLLLHSMVFMLVFMTKILVTMDIGQKCLQLDQTNHLYQKLDYIFDLNKWLRWQKLLVDMEIFYLFINLQLYYCMNNF